MSTSSTMNSSPSLVSCLSSSEESSPGIRPLLCRAFSSFSSQSAKKILFCRIDSYILRMGIRLGSTWPLLNRSPADKIWDKSLELSIWTIPRGSMLFSICSKESVGSGTCRFSASICSLVASRACIASLGSSFRSGLPSLFCLRAAIFFSSLFHSLIATYSSYLSSSGTISSGAHCQFATSVISGLTLLVNRSSL